MLELIHNGIIVLLLVAIVVIVMSNLFSSSEGLDAAGRTMVWYPVIVLVVLTLAFLGLKFFSVAGPRIAVGLILLIPSIFFMDEISGEINSVRIWLTADEEVKHKFSRRENAQVALALQSGNEDLIRKKIYEAKTHINFQPDVHLLFTYAINYGIQNGQWQTYFVFLKEAGGVIPKDILITRPLPFDIVKYLLENGADANATDPGNTVTPISLYCESHSELNNSTATLRLLFEKGANVDMKAQDLPPLFLVILYRKWELAAFLLDQGANIEYESAVGDTYHVQEMIRSFEKEADSDTLNPAYQEFKSKLKSLKKE